MLIGDLPDEFQCLFSSACEGECVCYYRIILLLLSYMSIIYVRFVLKLL